MGVKDSAKRAGAASIAVATTGLSTCLDGGGVVVDPAPPPLVCSTVAGGQTLVATGRREGDLVIVTVRVQPGEISNWRITRVGDAVGGTITATALPASLADSLVVTARPATPGTTLIDFTVEGELTGFRNERCAIRRTFHITIAPTGVQVSEMNFDLLPLGARERAEIVMLGREGRTVSLEAHTGYTGPIGVVWEVTGGELAAATERLTRWTLPTEPGIYQAELLIDYGPDGVAFDALQLEVTE